jgi:hypothetical protein
VIGPPSLAMAAMPKGTAAAGPAVSLARHEEQAVQMQRCRLTDRSCTSRSWRPS